jgi:hypothetical protein
MSNLALTCHPEVWPFSPCLAYPTQDGGLCWSPTGGPHSPSMAVSPVPQRVSTPAAGWDPAGVGAFVPHSLPGPCLSLILMLMLVGMGVTCRLVADAGAQLLGFRSSNREAAPSTHTKPALPPLQVQSPFANGPGGMLLGSSHSGAAMEAGPSAGRMKAPVGSSGLPSALNRALQAFPSGSGDASRRSSTSSYQHMGTAAAGGGAGMREYPSSARQMSCLGTGRYGSAMRGDDSGDLGGDMGDVHGATRPRRTTRRPVESRHKVSDGANKLYGLGGPFIQRRCCSTLCDNLRQSQQQTSSCCLHSTLPLEQSYVDEP